MNAQNFMKGIGIFSVVLMLFVSQGGFALASTLGVKDVEGIKGVFGVDAKERPVDTPVIEKIISVGNTIEGDEGNGVDIDDDPMLGDPDALVTIIEFGGFQEPFSKNFHDNTLPVIKENYIDSGKINYVFRDLPFDFHEFGRLSAEASECADEQGMYWDYHDYLFGKQAIWSESEDEGDLLEKFILYSDAVGLNNAQFISCYVLGDTKDEVSNDIEDAEKEGINSAPTFFVQSECGYEKKILGAGPYSGFEEITEEALDSCDWKGEVDTPVREKIISLKNSEENDKGSDIDIAVTYLDVSDESPEVGDTVNVKYVVKNLGDVTTSVAKYSQVINPDGSGGGGGGCCFVLGPGVSHTFEFDVSADVEGVYEIEVGASAEEGEDIDLENNQKMIRFKAEEVKSESSSKQTDIAVTDIKVDPDKPEVGETTFVSMIIENKGDYASEFTFAYEIETPDAEVENEFTVSLEAGEIKDFSFGFTPDIAGDYKIVAGVSDSDIPDENPENDLLAVNFETNEAIICPADTNGDLTVNVEDLINVILQWGGPGPIVNNADVNNDGMVNEKDLDLVIDNWGICE